MGGKKFKGKPFSLKNEDSRFEHANQYDKRGSGNANYGNAKYQGGGSWIDSDKRYDRRQTSYGGRGQQHRGNNRHYGASSATQYNGDRSVRDRENGGTSEVYQSREMNGQVGNMGRQTILSEGLNPRDSELKTLVCTSCQNPYNLKELIPKSLPCGHSVCSICLMGLLEGTPRCKTCGAKFEDKREFDNYPTDYQLQGIIEAMHMEESADVRREENRLSRQSSEHSKQVVTVGSDEPGKNARKRDRPLSQERSPHGSRCLEIGIKPSHYCALCLKWVCERCGQIEHSQNKCYLIPKAEALGQMNKAQKDGAKSAQEALESTLTELTKYEESLDSFSLVMQAAFESILTEKERVKSMKEVGLKKIKGLNAVVEDLPNVKNLPEALAAINLVESKCMETQVWQEDNLMGTLDQRKVVNITKEILLCTVFMKLMAENEARPCGHLLAQHHVNGERVYSHLEANGGRVLVYALRKIKTVPVGSRAVSLNSILTCLDRASSLTFLDIDLNGVRKERVFIRLTGDTVRGRQFLALCTGMLGPSFRKTPFHRMWWKGRPGEHLWGGDYDHRDGSGGTSLLEHMKEEIDAKPLGRKVPVTAGLVAGRYEQGNVSSVFRIYTKGQKTESRRGAYGGYADPPEETAEDEAAFGQVEHGLGVLQEAIEHGNIQDVTIIDCGIVIETGMFQ
ncbi:uncharacterized protein LOC135212938 [Macrobrachium nipponense]|uniref:uncharacterized protein LOC135212938 n=1 Tax=Macrobrachium nipponense TaxID=159736 RepID=UPI0030C7A7E1